MHRKKIVSLVSLFGIFLLFQNYTNSSRPWYQNKKGAGVSVWRENDPTGRNHNLYIESAYKELKLLNTSWYYTWTTKPLVKATKNDEFYPMIWSYDTVKKMPVNRGVLTMENQINDIKNSLRADNLGKYKRVLMFNEPDNKNIDGGQNPIGPWQAANQIKNKLPEISALADIVVAPVVTHTPINGSIGEIWLDDFFKYLPFANFMRESDEKRIIPLHIYLDPFKLGLASRAEDFYDTGKRDQIIKSMLDYFISEVHQVKRKYKARIMITEFGIADWEAKGVRNGGFNNRIPSSFIADFYKYLLPELYLRDYVSHFALFTNSVGSSKTKEALASNAAFFRDENYYSGNPNTSGKLTDVGLVYAQAQHTGLCQKGEYVDSNDNIVEFFHIDCGAPVDFGWTGSSNTNANNGWYVASHQYRRVLTKAQAGYYAYKVSVGCERGRLYDRHRGEIVEFRSAKQNCGERPAGWSEAIINNQKQYRKIYNIRTERIGVIQFPKYRPMVMSSSQQIAGDQIQATSCERSQFLYKNVRYEQACGCYQLSSKYYPVNDRGTKGQTCFHSVMY